MGYITCYKDHGVFSKGSQFFLTCKNILNKVLGESNGTRLIPRIVKKDLWERH